MNQIIVGMAALSLIAVSVPTVKNTIADNTTQANDSPSYRPVSQEKSPFNLGEVIDKTGGSQGPECSPQNVNHRGGTLCVIAVDTTSDKNQGKAEQINAIEFPNVVKPGGTYYGRPNMRVALVEFPQAAEFMKQLDTAQIYYSNSVAGRKSEPQGATR